MCGICGIAWHDQHRTTPPNLLEQMAQRLAHRGPDGFGFYEQPGIALGHRRLSIIDLPGGGQPLANEDETIWTVFNGEIYNFQELRQSLLARGHRLRTHSDTEVLVHLYEEMGDDMVTALRGMFAFAIWDQRDENRQRLLLARDRMGQKPLVYWHDAAGLRFASELKALLEEPAFPREVDPQALDAYLMYQYVPHPRTIYRNVWKLPPAHLLTYEQGRVNIRQYWSVTTQEESTASEAELIAQLRDLLAEATRMQMISDVPLGAFLSGGIDSTIIVGLMRQAASGPVKTFSIGCPVKEYDETHFARQAAKHLGTDHDEFLVVPDAVHIAEELAELYDEPFADSSAIPTYYVSQLTRRHVTVALSGDAGDELFGGYRRYQAVQGAAYFDRLPGFIRALAASRLGNLLPASGRQKSRWRQLRRLLSLLHLPPRQRYSRLVSIFDEDLRPTLYTPEFQYSLAGHQASAWLESYYDQAAARDFLSQTMYVDQMTYLPGDILTKVDIASMAHGLEARAPFLDHHVVEFAARLPSRWKLHGRTTKYLLKKAFAEFLPPAMRNRGKMGFGVPLDHWLRQELLPLTRELLQDGRLKNRGWLRQEAVDKVLQDHLACQWDHSARLWALMMLELWARRYLD